MPDDPTEVFSKLPAATLLIADDEEGVRLVLSEYFTGLDYRVIEACDGAEAFARYLEQPIDLVITDINMPSRNGLELLQEVRRRDPRLPVVIITGRPSVEAAVECIRKGAADFITKPFDLPDLAKRVGTIIADRRKESTEQLAGTVVVNHSDRTDVPAGYRIVRTIGQGNMGTVYLVEREPTDGEQYAMKVMRAGALSPERRENLLERFRHEARAAMMVNHPHVVRFIDFGTAQDSANPYLVMEYLRGLPLKLLMNRRDLPLAVRVSILVQLADALGAIHAVGICHRDVKPGNVIVDDRFTAKLTDFGVAHLPDSQLTLTTAFIGSPAYMAPEAYHTARVDHRADLFSLGSVAYEFLTGAKPFLGENLPQMMNAVRNQEPVPPTRLVQTLPLLANELITGLLAKRPEARYQSAAEVAAVLRQLHAQVA